MTDNNTQQSMTEDAETYREMAAACLAARRAFPDEALAQMYLIARFLGNPSTFIAKKRILELVLRRRIGLQRPYTETEFHAAIDKADRVGPPAEIIVFQPRRTH